MGLLLDGEFLDLWFVGVECSRWSGVNIGFVDFVESLNRRGLDEGKLDGDPRENCFAGVGGFLNCRELDKSDLPGDLRSLGLKGWLCLASNDEGGIEGVKGSAGTSR